MKVALITSWITRRGGGIADAVLNLSKGLNESGMVECRVFGLGGDCVESVAEAGRKDIRVFKVAGPGAFGFAAGLSDALFRFEPDLVHVHGLWMYPSVVSLNWAARSGRPLMVSPHGMLDPWALQHSAWKKRIAGWLYEYRHLRKAACLHALCDAEAAAMRAHGLTNPIRVIPNGVTIPSDAPEHTLPVWASALPDDARVLLYLGRLHPKKNLRALIEAWAMISADQVARSWWLVIAGWDQGGYESLLRQSVGQQRIPRVIFAGPQFDQAKDYSFRRADAFVLPSLSEGLPVAVLEAWSYGLPVLMTQYCNLPQGFSHGAAQQIGTTAQAVVGPLRTLISMSKTNRLLMGANGRALVARTYTWPRIAGEMLIVYRGVLDNASFPVSASAD